MARALILSALLCLRALAQIPELHDDASLGLPTGALAPAFSLVDQFGHLQTPGSLAGPKGLILIFLRSADW